MILLEIGLWQSVDTLAKFDLVDPSHARGVLWKTANERLGYFVGEVYKQVVLDCLSGTSEQFGGGATVENNPRFQAEFRVKVVEALKKQVEVV